MDNGFFFFFCSVWGGVVVMTVVLIGNPTHPGVSLLHLLLPQIVYLPTSRRDTNKARQPDGRCSDISQGQAA